MAEDYTQVYTVFLEEHPEWLDAVRYIPLPDSDEPQMYLRSDALRAFLVWGMAKGYFRHPERVPEFLAAMQREESGEL